MNIESPAELGKFAIVKALRNAFGYTRYLEITTGTTGHVYGDARAAGFAICKRLVYRLDGFPKTDGELIDFPAGGDDTREAMQRIRARGLEFDIVLVDPHHTYACSMRDLRDAFSLIRTSGALVVHDCNPPDAWIAGPDFVPGPWCGVTYKAFIDFVRDNDELHYFTVDTDYGCGVILKRPPRTGLRRLRDMLDHLRRPAAERDLSRRWLASGADYGASFDLFERERRRLLRLMTPGEFLRHCGTGGELLRAAPLLPGRS